MVAKGTQMGLLPGVQAAAIFSMPFTGRHHLLPVSAGVGHGLILEGSEAFATVIVLWARGPGRASHSGDRASKGA